MAAEWRYGPLAIAAEPDPECFAWAMEPADLPPRLDAEPYAMAETRKEADH